MLDENGNPIEEEKKPVENIVDDEDADKIRKEAKEKADEKTKTKVDDDAAKLLKEVMALKNKLKEKDRALSEVNDKYKDIDLEAARDALKKAEEAENKDLERKGEYERLLTKQKEKADALIEAERNAKSELEKKLFELQRNVDELSLGNAFANSKFIQEKMALTPNKTRALYASHFEIEDGKLVAFDKPKGTPGRTQLINASGDSLPFDEAIAEIINSDPDKDYLLKAEGRPGAGSKSTAKTDTEPKKKFVDTVDKIAAGLKNDKNFGPQSAR